MKHTSNNPFCSFKHFEGTQQMFDKLKKKVGTSNLLRFLGAQNETEALEAFSKWFVNYALDEGLDVSSLVETELFMDDSDVHYDIQEIINSDGSINFSALERITNTYFKKADSSLFNKGRKTLSKRKEHHYPSEKNTLQHLKNVVKSAESIEIREDLKPALILAAALHDIAKPFHGGQKHGSQSALLISKLFKSSDPNIELVRFAVRHHMLTLEDGKEFTTEDARRIMQDASDKGFNLDDAIDLLLALNQADVLSGRDPNTKATKKDTSEENVNLKYTLQDVLNEEIPGKRILLNAAKDIVEVSNSNDLSHEATIEQALDNLAEAIEDNYNEKVEAEKRRRTLKKSGIVPQRKALSLLVQQFYDNSDIALFRDELIDQMCEIFTAILDMECNVHTHPDRVGIPRSVILHELNKKHPNYIVTKIYDRIQKVYEKQVELGNSHQAQCLEAILNQGYLYEAAVQLMYRRLIDIERINMGEVNSPVYKDIVKDVIGTEHETPDIKGFTKKVFKSGKVTYERNDAEASESTLKDTTLGTIQEILGRDITDDEIVFSESSYYKNAEEGKVTDKYSKEELLEILKNSSNNKAISISTFKFTVQGNSTNIILHFSYDNEGKSGVGAITLTGDSAEAVIKNFYPAVYDTSEDDSNGAEAAVKEDGDSVDTEDPIKDLTDLDTDDPLIENGEMTLLEESTLERWMEKADTKTVREGIASQVRRLFTRVQQDYAMNPDCVGILGRPRGFDAGNMYVHMTKLRSESRASNSAEFFEAIRERGERAVINGDTSPDSFDYFCHCLVMELFRGKNMADHEKMMYVTLLYENFDKASMAYTIPYIEEDREGNNTIKLQKDTYVINELYNSYQKEVLNISEEEAANSVFDNEGHIKTAKAKSYVHYMQEVLSNIDQNWFSTETGANIYKEHKNLLLNEIQGKQKRLEKMREEVRTLIASGNQEEADRLDKECTLLNEEIEKDTQTLEDRASINAVEDYRKTVLYNILNALLLTDFMSPSSITNLASAANTENFKAFLNTAIEMLRQYSDGGTLVDLLSSSASTKARRSVKSFLRKTGKLIKIYSPSSTVLVERSTRFGDSSYYADTQHSMVSKQLDQIASYLKNDDKEGMLDFLKKHFLNDLVYAKQKEDGTYTVYHEWVRHMYNWATGKWEMTTYLKSLMEGTLIRGLGMEEDLVAFDQFKERDNALFNLWHFLAISNTTGKEEALIPSFILGDADSIRYLHHPLFKSQSHIMKSYLAALRSEIIAFKQLQSMSDYCEGKNFKKLPGNTGKFSSSYFPKLADKVNNGDLKLDDIVATIEKVLNDVENNIDSTSDGKQSDRINYHYGKENTLEFVNLVNAFKAYVAEDIEDDYNEFRDFLERNNIAKEIKGSGYSFVDKKIPKQYQDEWKASLGYTYASESFDNLDDIRDGRRDEDKQRGDDWLYLAFLNFKFGIMSHINFTVATPSYYRDTEDMQKRWKSWFATGSHLDLTAADCHTSVVKLDDGTFKDTVTGNIYTADEVVMNPFYDSSNPNSREYYKKACPSGKQKVVYFQDIRECTSAETDSEGYLVDASGNRILLNSKPSKKELYELLDGKDGKGGLAVRTELGRNLIDNGISPEQYDLFDVQKQSDGKYAIYAKGSSLTDGQAYRSLDSYRQIQIMLGEWDKNPANQLFYEKVQQLKKVLNGRSIFDENGHLIKDEQAVALYNEAMALNFIAQPEKPLYAGYEEIETADGTIIHVPVFHKYSERILIPELLPNGQDRMLGIAMQNKNIDMLASTECVKVGRFGQATLNFNSQNDLEDSLSSTEVPVQGKTNVKVHELSYEGYKEQTKVPYKVNHDTIVGTQSRKINGYTGLGNADEEFICSLLSKPKEGEDPGLFDCLEDSDYITLYKDSRGNKVTIHRNSNGKFSGKDMMGLTNAIFAHRWLSAYRDVRNVFNNKQSFTKMLQTMLIRDTKLSGRELIRLNLVTRRMPNGDTKREWLAPLSEGLSYKDTVAHLLSVFKKRAVKQWSNGGSFVQVSPVGSNLKMKIENGNVIYSQCARTWDYSYINEDGEEVKLNYQDYVDPATGRLLKPDGTVCGEELDDELESKLHKEFPGILDSLAVRIPTEKLYSTIHLRAVKFYPPCMGGIMAVSSAYTTIAGFDFDIDKLYVKSYKFKARVQHRKLSNSELKTIWEAIYADNEDIYEALKKASEKDGNSKKYYDRYWEEAGLDPQLKRTLFQNKRRELQIGYTEEEKEYLEKYGRWMGYHDPDIPLSALDPVVLDNILLKIELDRLHEPSTLKERLTPGGFYNLRRITPAMKRVVAGDLSGIKSYKELLETPYNAKNMNPSSPVTLFHYQSHNTISGKLIGIGAVQNIKQKLFDMLKTCKVSDNPNPSKAANPILFGSMVDRHNSDPNVGIDFLLSRSTQGMDNGEDAGLNLSELLAAAVDAVKEACLEYFQVDTDTADLVTTALALGAKWEDVGLLFNQPIVIEAVRICEENSFIRFPEALVQAFEKMASSKNTSLQGISEDSKFLTQERLFGAIRLYAGFDENGNETFKKYGYRNNLSEASAVDNMAFLHSQAQVIFTMRRLQKQSTAITSMIHSSRQDAANAYGTTHAAVENLIKAANLFVESLEEREKTEASMRNMTIQEEVSHEKSGDVFPIKIETYEDTPLIDMSIVNHLFDRGKVSAEAFAEITGTPFAIPTILLALTKDMLKCMTPYFAQLSPVFEKVKSLMDALTTKKLASDDISETVDTDLVSMLLMRIAANPVLCNALGLDPMFNPDHVVFVDKQNAQGLGIKENVPITAEELIMDYFPKMLHTMRYKNKELLSQYAIFNHIRVETNSSGQYYIIYENIASLGGDKKEIIGESWAKLCNDDEHPDLQQLARMLVLHCLYTRGLSTFGLNTGNAWMDVAVKQAMSGYFDTISLLSDLRMVGNKIVYPMSEFNMDDPSTYVEVADIEEILKVLLLNNAVSNNWWQMLRTDFFKGRGIYRTCLSDSIYSTLVALSSAISKVDDTKAGEEYGVSLGKHLLEIHYDRNRKKVVPKAGSIIVRIPYRGEHRFRLASKIVDNVPYIQVPAMIQLIASTARAGQGMPLDYENRYFVLKNLSKGNWVKYGDNAYDTVKLDKDDRNERYFCVEYELVMTGSNDSLVKEWRKSLGIFDAAKAIRQQVPNSGHIVRIHDERFTEDSLRSHKQLAKIQTLFDFYFGSEGIEGKSRKSQVMITLDLETNGLLDDLEKGKGGRIQIAEFSMITQTRMFTDDGIGTLIDGATGISHEVDNFLNMYDENGQPVLPQEYWEKGPNPIYKQYMEGRDRKEPTWLLNNILLPIVGLFENNDVHICTYNGNKFDIPVLVKCFEYAIENLPSSKQEAYLQKLEEFCTYFGITREVKDYEGHTRTEVTVSEDGPTIDNMQVVISMYPGGFISEDDPSAATHKLRDVIVGLSLLGYNTHESIMDVKATASLSRFLASLLYKDMGFLEDVLSSNRDRAIEDHLIQSGTEYIHSIAANPSSPMAVIDPVLTKILKDLGLEGIFDSSIQNAIVLNQEADSDEDYIKALKYAILRQGVRGTDIVRWLKAENMVELIYEELPVGDVFKGIKINKELLMRKVKEWTDDFERMVQEDNLCES